MELLFLAIMSIGLIIYAFAEALHSTFKVKRQWRRQIVQNRTNKNG